MKWDEGGSCIFSGGAAGDGDGVPTACSPSPLRGEGGVRPWICRDLGALERSNGLSLSLSPGGEGKQSAGVGAPSSTRRPTIDRGRASVSDRRCRSGRGSTGGRRGRRRSTQPPT